MSEENRATDVRLPLPYRLLGYRLDKPGRGPVCAVCLMVAVIAILGNIIGSLAFASSVLPFLILYSVINGVIAFIVGMALDVTMRRHLPLLPCPGCGEQPKQSENDLLMRLAWGDGSVRCANGCDVIPESNDRFEWNALCLQFARLCRENECPMCGRRITITRDPDTGRVVNVKCGCHVVYNNQSGRPLLTMLAILHNLAVRDRRKAETEERRLDGMSDMCARNGFELRDSNPTTSNHRQIREEPCETTD